MAGNSNAGQQASSSLRSFDIGGQQSRRLFFDDEPARDDRVRLPVKAFARHPNLVLEPMGWLWANRGHRSIGQALQDLVSQVGPLVRSNAKRRSKHSGLVLAERMIRVGRIFPQLVDGDVGLRGSRQSNCVRRHPVGYMAPSGRLPSTISGRGPQLADEATQSHALGQPLVMGTAATVEQIVGVEATLEGSTLEKRFLA
jgi:hypothetical protein